MANNQNRKQARYQRIVEQLRPLVEQTHHLPSRMATINAVLHHKLSKVSWTGFYLLEGGELLVGPYQGPLACQRLALHKGVCWAAILRKEAVVVPDVHQFEGHIACDSRSQSEIVVPVFNKEKEVIGCLDIDSTYLNNFDEVDAQYLTEIVSLLYIGKNE